MNTIKKLHDVYYYAFGSLLYIKILLQVVLNANTRSATFIRVLPTATFRQSHRGECIHKKYCAYDTPMRDISIT